MADVRATPVPAYLPRRGTALDAPALRTVQARVLSVVEACKALKGELGDAYTPQVYGWVSAKFPEGVPEDQLAGICAQFTQSCAEKTQNDSGLRAPSGVRNDHLLPQRHHVENPPVGKRLEISVIAAEVGLSVTDMAEACGISRTSLFSLISDNVWPVRSDPQAIRTTLRELFASKGASDEQLAVLFDAHVHRRVDVVTRRMVPKPESLLHPARKRAPRAQPPQAPKKRRPTCCCPNNR